MAVWGGYIALFGIAVETGVVIVVYLHEALDRRLVSGAGLKHEDIEEAVIEGAVQRLRPKLMTVCAVLASLVPILWESGIGSDVMKPIAAPIVGGMITSTVHVLILVPVFFALMKERALKHGTSESVAREGNGGKLAIDAATARTLNDITRNECAGWISLQSRNTKHRISAGKKAPANPEDLPRQPLKLGICDPHCRAWTTCPYTSGDTDGPWRVQC